METYRENKKDHKIDLKRIFSYGCTYRTFARCMGFLENT